MVTEDLAHEARIEAMRRDSGITLGTDGDFRYQGSLVAHPRVQALFHRGIELKPSGEVAMRVGRWWCYVACEGPAFFVEGLRRGSDGDQVAHLRGGRELALRGALLGYAADIDRIYLWSNELPGPAILLRQAHQEALVLIMDAGEAWFAAGAQGVLRVTACESDCVMLAQGPSLPDAPRPGA